MQKTCSFHRTPDAIAEELRSLISLLRKADPSPVKGICGFDGFIDTFIRLQKPSSMAEFGPKVEAAAGIATSMVCEHLGDKFGGNGPLFATALHGLFNGRAAVTYIGGVGDGEVLPIYREAMESQMAAIHGVAPPAHTDCLEFTDGKVMLCDLGPCEQITLERVLERVGGEVLDRYLREARFLGTVNWGKLVNVGPLWSYLSERLSALGRPVKEVVQFMDLAEFEGRDPEDLDDLLSRLPAITRQCRTLLSFNLKEAWQMGAHLGRGEFHGCKDGASVADLASFLRSRIDVDRIIIHPNDGAACASAEATVYAVGPYCASPLISTGAGDHFGAGCLAATLLGATELETILLGNATSGYFVRSGRTPTLTGAAGLLEQWLDGELPERL